MSEPKTTAPRRSFAGRFLNWLFSWRTFRRALIALIGLVTLAALVVTEENWRGKRDWEKYKSEVEARGEHFDLASFTSKPVHTASRPGAGACVVSGISAFSRALEKGFWAGHLQCLAAA